MELNRNHYLGIGMILLLLGLQFRLVDSFHLNDATTTFLAKRMKKKEKAVTSSPLTAIFGSTKPNTVPKTLRPPKWIGWSLVSIGGVLVAQSLGMRKPG